MTPLKWKVFKNIYVFQWSILAMVCFALCLFSGEGYANVLPKKKVSKGEMTDSRDGKIYATVKIGKQTWMAENLNFIPQQDSSWCYENKEENCLKYGRLYDWQTAQWVCPDGWVLAELDDWTELHTGEIEWILSKDMKGTNDYLFNILPAGKRTWNGSFFGIGNLATFWTIYKIEGKYEPSLHVRKDELVLTKYGDSEMSGLSVRCLKSNGRKHIERGIGTRARLLNP